MGSHEQPLRVQDAEWNMRINQRNLQVRIIHSLIILVGFLLIGCFPRSSPAPEIGPGSFKGEVIASWGEPDQAQDFILPAEPFFGPQESLVNLVPAGTLIEEWVYEIEDELLYIWFTGEEDKPRDSWPVLATGRYPKDAIY
jgi:hypothetical protein